MTQSSNLTKLHEAQVKLANETLVNYRDFITKEFIDEFGSSYQTAAQFKDIWRKAFKYAPECEAFLINKSKLFVAMLPTDNKLYKNPKFLKILIRKICEYLSTYTCRIAEKPNIPANQQIINRSKFANNLFAALFENNTYVQ
nr:hypothetical protein [Candidatus Enterousia merdequi]